MLHGIPYILKSNKYMFTVCVVLPILKCNQGQNYCYEDQVQTLVSVLDTIIINYRQSPLCAYIIISYDDDEINITKHFVPCSTIGWNMTLTMLPAMQFSEFDFNIVLILLYLKRQISICVADLYHIYKCSRIGNCKDV